MALTLSLDSAAKMILSVSAANPAFLHQSILSLLKEQGNSTHLVEGSYTHEIRGDQLILTPTTTIYITMEGYAYATEYWYDEEDGMTHYDSGIYEDGEEDICSMEVTPEELEALEDGEVEPKQLEGFKTRVKQFPRPPLAPACFLKPPGCTIYV